MSHKIEFDINRVGKGTVTLDGRPLHCRAFRVSGQCGKLSKVTIQLLADVSGKVEIEDFQSIARREGGPGEDVTGTHDQWAHFVRGGIMTPDDSRKELDA